MKIRPNQHQTNAATTTHKTPSTAPTPHTASSRRRSSSNAAPQEGSDLKELVVLHQNFQRAKTAWKQRKGDSDSNASGQSEESIENESFLQSYTSNAENLNLKVGGDDGRQGNSQSGSDSDSDSDEQANSDAETPTRVDLSLKAQHALRPGAASAGMRADAAWAEAELCKLAAQSPQHAHAASRQTRVNDVSQMYLNDCAKHGVTPKRRKVSEVREDLIVDFKQQTPEAVKKLAAMVLTIADQNYNLLLPILRLKLFLPRLPTQYGSPIARSRSLSRSNSLRKLRK